MELKRGEEERRWLFQIPSSSFPVLLHYFKKRLALNLSISSSTGNFWVQSRESYRHSIDKKEPQGGNRSDCFYLWKKHPYSSDNFQVKSKSQTETLQLTHVWLTCLVFADKDEWQHRGQRRRTDISDTEKEWERDQYVDSNVFKAWKGKWLSGESVNHTEHQSNVFNKLRSS